MILWLTETIHYHAHQDAHGLLDLSCGAARMFPGFVDEDFMRREFGDAAVSRMIENFVLVEPDAV